MGLELAFTASHKELQHDATRVFPPASDDVPHFTARSPSKSRADRERNQSPTRTSISSQHIVAPLTDTGAQQNLSLWPRTTASVTSSAVARLPRACQTLDGRRLFSRHGRVAWSDTTVPDPCGTASPDAVPQLHGWQSLSPAKPAMQLLRLEWPSTWSRTLRKTSRASVWWSPFTITA